jgi:hypothetical protein
VGGRFQTQDSRIPRDITTFKILVLDVAVEEVFEFNRVPNEQRVSLMVHTFQGVVATWWQYLKQRKRQQGKLKISSWEQLLKEL